MTIDRQEAVVKELFERHFSSDSSAELVGLFKDEGYNLETEEPSRQFWQIIKLIKQKKINTLIVSSDDRIFRGESGELRGRITDAFRHNRIKLITSSSSLVYDPAETSSRIASSVTQELGAVAKLESMKILQDGRRRKLAEKGDWFLNVTPFGIRCERYFEGKAKKYRYHIIEEEAKYVRDIFKLYVGEKPDHLPHLGKRLGATNIAKLLNDANVSRADWVAAQPENTATEGWDKQKVLRIILNETYTGRLVVNFNPTKKVSGFDEKRTLATIEIPSIIDDRLFDKAQKLHAAIKDKLIDDRQPRTETNWLHGLIDCPQCELKLVGRIANSDHRYYGCSNHHGIYRADDLEGIAENLLTAIIFDDGLIENLTRAANSSSSSDKELIAAEAILKSKTKELSEMEAKLDALLEKNLAGLVSDDQYARFREKLSERDEVLKKEIAKTKVLIDKMSENKITSASFTDVQRALRKALKSEGKKEKILRLSTETLFSKLWIEIDSAETDGLSEEKVGALYQEGRLTLKDVREVLGWSPKKIYGRFGKTSRKSRIDFKLMYSFKVPALTVV